MVDNAVPDGKQAEVRETIDQHLRTCAANPPKVTDPTTAPADHTDEDPRAAELAKMSAEVRAEAEDMLRDPDLLKRVSQDTLRRGQVFEHESLEDKRQLRVRHPEPGKPPITWTVWSRGYEHFTGVAND
jgi:hypothetical protein